MTKKLYRVVCRGMTTTTTGVAHGYAYVVAENPDQAYMKLLENLETQELGFDDDRELKKIELLAEETEYPKCRIRLYD